MKASALTLLITGLIGCGGGAKPWILPENAAIPAYTDALQTWTRRDETYEYFESRVFVRATWFSPAFAASYAQHRAQRLGMSATEATVERTRHLDAARQELRFFLAVVTNDPFWNDLDRGEEATLRARLMEKGEALLPTHIERISDNELADMAPFFPYADALSRGYWITFPMTEGAATRGVHLRIAGPPAIVNLRWEVR